ncbi:MAG: tetratricopeptide repeat protein [Cytophagales bacterium]|nr:tetratricopeptide repeat protein [Cytophagales bacterium]
MTESKRAYSIWYMSDATSIPLTWYQGISGFYLNLPDKGLSYSLDSYRLSPYNIHVLNNLGSAYEANGDHTSAKKCFEKALDLYNSFDAAKFNLSVMLYNEGKYKEARELVESTTSDNTKKETFLQVINQKLTE